MLNSVTYREDLERTASLPYSWEALAHKNVLITGATGLIGSCLADVLLYRNELFGSDIDLWVLSRSEENLDRVFGSVSKTQKSHLHYVVQSVGKPLELPEPMDYIVHAASKGDPVSFVKDPVGVMEANFLGMCNIIDYARRNADGHPVEKIVYISSGEAYGKLPPEVSEAISEDMMGTLNNLEPRNCYGVSKRAAETLGISAYVQFGLPISVARLCHVYGPTAMPDESRVVFQFLKNALEGKDIVLKSAGLQKRSYCYVTDTVSGILAVLMYGNDGEAYNVSNHNSVTTIKEMAETLSRMAGRQVILEAQSVQEQQGNSGIMHAVLNDEKLLAVGARMEYDMKAGLKRTLQILKEAGVMNGV